MKKVKFDERLENAMNAFFDNGPDTSRFEMTYTGGETAMAANTPEFTEKLDKWLRVLREIFMFGPGTFSLFYTTLTVAYFYPSLGFGFQGGLMWLFAAFLVYAGCGDIKKVRNLAVPASIVTMALGIVGFTAIFPVRDIADAYFWDSIYLFPLVLVTAKLVQYLVSDK